MRFDHVNTLAELTAELARCGNHEPKSLSFVELMRRPVPGAEFQRFCSMYPALAQIAEVSNVNTDQDFVAAAVRALHHAEQKP